MAVKKTTTKAPPAAGSSRHSSPDATESVAETAVPVVGIGASAGGLAAFEAFFSGMPAATDPGMAFVLVQHLAPDHKSILADLIRRYTREGHPYRLIVSLTSAIPERRATLLPVAGRFPLPELMEALKAIQLAASDRTGGGTSGTRSGRFHLRIEGAVETRCHETRRSDSLKKLR